MTRDKGESPFDDVVNDTDDESGGVKSPDQSDSSDSGSEEVRVEDDGSGKSPPDKSTAASDTAGGGGVAESDAPFPFADADQRAVYPLGETWDEFTDHKYFVDGELRSTYGIRNVETREVDEAILQLVTEELSTEEIAQRVVENRGFDVNLD